MYGLRWVEINRRNQLVTKEKFFKTEAARERHITRLEAQDRLHEILAYCDEN